jgi:hypothetical protein
MKLNDEEFLSRESQEGDWSRSIERGAEQNKDLFTEKRKGVPTLPYGTNVELMGSVKQEWQV